MSGSPRARGSVARIAVRALGAGLGIGLLVAAGGQAVGLVLFLAQGANGSYAPYVRLGAAYVQLFHHVPVALRLSAAGAPPFSAEIGIAFLLVTGVSLTLLSVAGRRLAPEGSAARALVAVAVGAGGYAAVPFALAFAVRGAVPIPGDLTLGTTVSIDAATSTAFVTPFLLAAVAMTLGALSTRAGTSGADRLVGDVLAGGLRAFGLALLFAIVGVLVLSSVQPSIPRLYGAVVSAPDSPKGRAVIAGHAALLVPDQALWVVVPAMGACDEVVLDGRATPFLCYWRRPTELPLLPDPSGVLPADPAFRPPPRGYLLFLLVPLLATIGGGLRAGRGSLPRRGRAAAGAAAGIVFAAVTAVAIALARIDLTVGGGFLGGSTFRVVVGPELVRGTLLALAWGVGGGAIGGLASRYVDAGTGISTE